MTDYNFDRVSQQYDESRGLPPGVPERIARWVLARLPRDPAITELGVGTGRIAVPFIRAGVRYTGFDISAKMMGILYEKLDGELGRAVIATHDITLPFPLEDASQDAVLCVHILHLVDAVTVLQNARRVLKPGGVLVWGYEGGSEQNPHTLLRQRFHAEADALGIERRDYQATPAREQLAQWGAPVSRFVVATWGQPESLRDHLNRLRAKIFSFTWSMTDEQVARIADRVEAWAAHEYGDLDLPRMSERQFIIDWYVLGGT